jgi:hypothetical protein
VSSLPLERPRRPAFGVSARRAVKGESQTLKKENGEDWKTGAFVSIVHVLSS